MWLQRFSGLKSTAILLGILLGVMKLIHIYVLPSAVVSYDVHATSEHLDQDAEQLKVNKPLFVAKGHDKLSQNVTASTETSQDDLLPMKAVLPKSLVDDHEDGIGVVNPHPYNAVLSNPNICRIKNLFMLVYVHTGADHYRRRAVIRQTWGDIKRFPNMRVLFVMGKTNNIKSMQDALQFESTAYGDILEEDFEDTYHNLTFKGIAALKFISHYCNNVEYILKTDDDVFVNMYTLQNHLMQLEGAEFTKNLILCSVSWKTDVRRAGKWAIPKEMYTEDLYPPYCQGLSYVLSTDVAPKLYDASFFVKFFWVDDVYIFGLLPKHINLKLNTMRNVYCNQREMEAFFAHPTEWYKYVFTHIHDEALFLKTWDQITKYAEKETIPTPTKISPGVLADFYESKGKLLKLFYEEKYKKEKKGD